MSIILKGIDMPKKGEHILALIKNDGKCSYFEETTISRIMKTTEAIQIPTPHGRMIDADELVKHLRKDPLFDLVERYGISGVIESRPTILEAEADE